MHHLTKPQQLIYDMEKYAGGSIATVCGSIVIKGKKEISEITRAVNELYRLNDALRIRITETEGIPQQYVTEYQEQEIQVLRFKDKTELDLYAEKYAKEAMDFYGSLCESKVVVLDNACGVLIKLHHIISDAWTLALCGTQFCKILNGETPSAYSYVDYIKTEEKYLNSKRYIKDSEYFSEQFKKCDEVTLISDIQSNNYEVKRKTIVLDKEKTAQLSDYTNRNNTSVFTLLMTVLGVYMSRIKMNAEKFYIGTAILNRVGLSEQNTVGMFINTVPLLIEIDNEKTFSENLLSVTDGSMSLLRHQRYNYGEILKLIRSKYNFNEKLYDVLLSYQNSKINNNSEDFESTWYNCGMQTESLQIHIDDRDDEGILKIHYDYQTEKFSESEIERMHEHLFNLLFDAIDEDKKITEINLLSPKETNILLHDFNDTYVEYEKNKCFHQLFAEQVKRTPDKTALIFEDTEYTFNQLDEMSNSLAHYLRENGVKPNDVIPIISKRSWHIFVAILAINKAGGAFMSVDPEYPVSRIEYMINEAGSQIALYMDYPFDFKINGINLDTFDFKYNTNDISNVNTSEDLTYVIFTSGSTGMPKGLTIRHKNATNFCDKNKFNICSKIIKDEYKLFLSVTNTIFDMFITECFIPLTRGYTILFANDIQAMNPVELSKLCSKYKPDIMETTPTKIKAYISNCNDLEYLHDLKAIILGGEALTASLLTELRKLTFAKIFNNYGPAETTVWSTIELTSNDEITIGKPIANTQIHIVDKYGNLMPIGQTGEICIAGDGVGAGYLNRPELTAEKFVDNPFGDGKMYKTGDLAYWREDGNIIYVGRNDFQVKIRGLRIELEEIENAICSVEGVSQSAVVVRKDESGRQLICAFYTEKSPVDLSDIKAAISAKLPKYMMPHISTVLNEMPLTASGKVNRKALPNIDLSSLSTNAEYVAPNTEKEEVLVSEIERVLNADKVGMLDNFFDLGGDSLKAIELISKLEAKGYKTTVKTVFDCETIKDLAEQLEQPETEVKAAQWTGDIPATDAQMRVYTAQSMRENSTLYNVPYCFKTENLDVSRLQNAVNKLIKRHESLRTHFENKDGQIIQVVNETANVNVEKLDSDNISAFIRPFDLSKAPLIRVGYYENIVMIDMHHVITDGSSMPVFFNEMNELYMGRTLDYEVVQYKEFALQEQNHSESEKYWLSVFDDEVPVLEMNTDFPRGQKQTYNGNALYDTIDIALHNRIKDKCKGLNITPYAFYMSGFNILLSKFSGAEDIVVGVPVIGRNSKNLTTIGMFVNTIALRNKPVGAKTVSEFLDEVKENSINAIANQYYPFGELVRKLNVEAGNRNPLFDVMFAYQSDKMTDIVFGDKQAELLPVPITSSKYDLTFTVLPREAYVVIMAEYCTDLYKENTVKRFIHGFKQILSAMLDETAFIKDISAISKEENDMLLYDFNNTIVDYPKDKCVHQLFEEQVLKTPGKTAVIACDKTLTYDELNKLSNRIANGLIEKGVKPNDIVSFALSRNSYLIAVMFGILKSGAAYMPIDPDYPQDRIDYMLEDSKAKFFITENNLHEFISGKEANPSVEMCSDNYCYCIYTSGSTGQPKGALLHHKGIINLVTNLSLYKDISKINTFGFMTTITFDVATQEILTALLNGFTGVLLPERKNTDIKEIIDIIEQKNVDIIYATPSYFDTLTSTKENASRILKALNTVALAGEKFYLNAIVKELQSKNNITFENQYGPVELHVIASATALKDNDYESIGKPIANNKAYIVDKYNSIVPIGQTGELCIAGDGVGAGYLNRPELTAEKFVDNPFGDGKMYKTGDLVYWREDGNIAYVGRNDFQVKIRGLRIELGEIENAICSVEGVSQAAVVVRKDETGRQLICAFNTEKESAALSDIKAAISAKLPKYMMPHIFTVLSEMPLTASGKINRKALPEVDLNNIDSGTEYVKPQTKLEKELAKIIEHVLNYAPVGVIDNFFDIGGDSLSAIEFVSKAHNKGIYFSLQNVYDYPTLKELAEFIKIGENHQITFDDTDFSEINKLLEENKTQKISMPQKSELGNILLTGATGFLGIHILADILDNDAGVVYCLVRGTDKQNSEERLYELLKFYFGEKYLNNKKIVVICADLQKYRFGLSESEYDTLLENIDTVINAAASVKHYGSYKYFYEVNTESTKRLIDFCFKSDAKLIHTSTLSVSGNSFADDFEGKASDNEQDFAESDLYIGQPLDNVYARSKFEAEKEVLDAMSNGLKANIMRMGNLTNRFSDAKFQNNYRSNAFLNRVKGLLDLGVFPDYLMNLYVEFTPIDDAAKAVMTIARHFNIEQNVFHINSPNVVYFNKLLDIFKKLNLSVRIVNKEEFAKDLRNTMEQSGTEYIFETFINDMDENDKLNYDSKIHIKNDFTVEYLKQLGFEWSDIGIEYIRKYIEYFIEIGYLDV